MDQTQLKKKKTQYNQSVQAKNVYHWNELIS